MRVPILTQRVRFLARSAAIMAIAGAAAGCSSNVMRFQDGLFTSSTSRQASMQAAAPQPQQQYAQPQAYPANVDSTYTGSINRQAVQPANVASRPQRGGHPVPSANVGLQPAVQQVPQVAVAQAAQPFPTMTAAGPVTRQQMPAPTMAAAAPVGVDRTVTGSVSAKPQPAAQRGADGWSSANGTPVTLREGETVNSLSKRYGVPVDAIVRTNGLKSASAVQAGQKIVIPTYSRGEAPADRAPGNQPAERLAVLPQVPRPSDKQAGPQANAAPANAAPTAGSVYTVQAGDTLSAIAQRMGTTTNAIKQANNLGIIRIGQKLTVPGASAQNVAAARLPAQVDPIVTGSTPKTEKATDGARINTYTPPAKAEKVIEENVEQAAAAPDATGIGRMRWPVRGRVVSAFGAQSGGKRNDGLDIAVPEGTSVKAAENGIVIYAGDGLKDFGNTVLVRHEDGLVTVYGHASEIKVSRGETVRRGQEIARSGISGNADTPKLHFEVRKNSTPVDPGKYLE
jgi:murein DD-endopeptidase MepM/ murein hydrolase activator NlpD